METNYFGWAAMVVEAVAAQRCICCEQARPANSLAYLVPGEADNAIKLVPVCGDCWDNGDFRTLLVDFEISTAGERVMAMTSELLGQTVHEFAIKVAIAPGDNLKLTLDDGQTFDVLNNDKTWLWPWAISLVLMDGNPSPMGKRPLGS